MPQPSRYCAREMMYLLASVITFSACARSVGPVTGVDASVPTDVFVTEIARYRVTLSAEQLHQRPYTLDTPLERVSFTAQEGIEEQGLACTHTQLEGCDFRDCVRDPTLPPPRPSPAGVVVVEGLDLQRQLDGGATSRPITFTPGPTNAYGSRLSPVAVSWPVGTFMHVVIPGDPAGTPAFETRVRIPPVPRLTTPAAADIGTPVLVDVRQSLLLAWANADETPISVYLFVSTPSGRYRTFQCETPGTTGAFTVTASMWATLRGNEAVANGLLMLHHHASDERQVGMWQFKINIWRQFAEAGLRF